MNKKDINRITNKIKILTNENVHKIFRAGDVATFGFGEPFEKINSRGTRMVPRFALHISCCFRLTCGDEIVLSRDDIFRPALRSLQLEDYKTDFDWTGPYGNNRYEEIAESLFSKYPIEFKIKKLTISKLGDLTISFENDFVLEVFIDTSEPDECWRFFDNASNEEHLIITGQGIERGD